MTNPLIDSLTAVVADRPQDLALRAHLAELLIEEGRGAEAIPHLGVVLAAQSYDEHAAALMRHALGVPGVTATPSNPVEEVPADADEADSGSSVAADVPATPSNPEGEVPADAEETDPRSPMADEEQPADDADQGQVQDADGADSGSSLADDVPATPSNPEGEVVADAEEADSGNPLVDEEQPADDAHQG